MLRTGSHSAAASRPTTAAPTPATAACTASPLAGRGPERQRRTEQQERRQEDRDERDRRAGDPVRRTVLDRTEIRGEREERARARPGRRRSPARNACWTPSPARRRRRSGAAARRGRRRRPANPTGRSRGRGRERAQEPRRGGERQADEQARRSRVPDATAVRGRPGSAASAAAALTPSHGTRRRRRAPATRIVRDLAERARHEQRDRGGRGRDRQPDGSAGKRPRHRDHGGRDHGGRGELEPVHPARVGEIDIRGPRARAPSGSAAEGSVKPSQAASPPSLPARCTPIAIPTWLDDGPGRRLESATSSPNCSSPIHPRRATYSARK